MLGQRLTTNHLLVQKSTKISTTQVQLVRARVVTMIIGLIMGLRPQLHPPEKELRGRLLEMMAIGPRIAVKDILLLMNGDILLPMSEEEEGQGGEGTMREGVDHLPRQQRDRKGVEPRIVSVSEAVVQRKELEIEKEVNMMMAIIKGAEEAEVEEGSSNHHIQPHRRITCLRTEGAFPLAVAGDPLCYQIHQDPPHYYHLLT